MSVKTCTRCNEEKTWDAFDKRANATPVAYCKPCRKVYARERYTATADHVKQRTGKNKATARMVVWEYLKNHPCVDCGERDPVVLEFDHRDPSTKLYEVSKMVRNTANLIALHDEMCKCDVRCANCHRRRTAIQFGWYQYMPPEYDFNDPDSDLVVIERLLGTKKDKPDYPTG